MSFIGFQDFRQAMFPMGCFHIHQVSAWHPGFDKNNLGRWVGKGWLLKLRNGVYSFPEYLQQPGFGYYVANRMYMPSYISLHTALAFYGIIPESVVQITSVTSLKTVEITNAFGTFSYKSVRENLMFGYEAKPLADDRSLFMAFPEKAILDLLYLYPFYDTEGAMRDLRLDEDFMDREFNWGRLETFVNAFQSKALDKRARLLINTYRS